MFDPLVLTSAFLVALVGYLLVIMPDLMPESVQFGVRLPPAHQHDPVLNDVRRRYRRNVAVVLSVAFAFVLALGLLASSTAVELVSIVPIFLLLGGGFACYLSGRSRLLSAKSDGAWTKGVPQVATAPLTRPPASSSSTLLLWAVPMLVLWLLFLAMALLTYPTLPSSIPTHFSPSGAPDAYAPKTWGVVLLIPALGAFLLVLFLGIACAIVRTRSEIDPARAEVDAARQRIFRERMARVLLVLGSGVEATLGLTSLSTLGLVPFGPLLLGLTLVPLLAGVLLVTVVSVQTGQLGARVALGDGGGTAPGPSSPLPMARDDDRLWKAGALYYNPEDSSLLVAKRFGVGWTLNFAHPGAWAFLIAIVALPVALALLLA